MKRVLSVIAIAVVLLFSPVSVSAHSGDTDLNGGHYNWETRDYHYHHGHPAHYHTDGVCPYGDYEQYTAVGSETRYDRLSKLASLLTEDGYDTSVPDSLSSSNYVNDYTRGYQQGFARGQENAEYSDGVSDGYKIGYQDGLEDGECNHFQYYPFIIAAISVIAAVIILSMIASRQKIKNDYKIELSDHNQKLHDLDLKYQEEIESHQKDRIEMKAVYEKLVEAQKQIFSSEKNVESADQRVKSCEQFISIFGGSAEEFFAHQDAPQRLAKMQADYLTLVYEASAIYLENKEHPAYKEAQRIRELKADTARYIERMKKAEYECDQLREQLRIAKRVYSVSDHTET